MPSIDAFSDIEDNIIEDTTCDFNNLCERTFRSVVLPGILRKTVHALELLQDKYDVFFRPNLSSLIKVSAFENFVQSRESICYSGAWAWVDSLRKDLIHHCRVGPEKSIKTLSELDRYEGNTFISGSGYFLSAKEVKSLVRRKNQIRYDIIDDVSMGLMFSTHEVLPTFSTCVTRGNSMDKILNVIRNNNACHIRLQHLPLELAQELWQKLSTDDVWK
ncbi:hypothetical protein N9H39_05180 [Gammaproteobacteria bacterium]|nr:hypothetical protein [Gammaproteobacteria bacterium]